MASERSLYSKVRLVLDASLSAEPETLGELSDRVLAQGHSAFVTRQYDPDADDYVWKASRPSVVRAVGVSRRLGLIDDVGQLTPEGRDAHSSDGAFGRGITAAAASRLADSGAVISDLNELAVAMLRRSPPEMPTAAAFFQELGPAIGKAEFSRLLTLMADAGSALIAQRRVYLEFSVA